MNDEEKKASILKAHGHVQGLISKISMAHKEFIESEMEGFSHNEKIIMGVRAFNYVSSHVSTTLHNRLREIELENCGDFKV